MRKNSRKIPPKHVAPAVGGSLYYHKPLDKMTPEEGLAWLVGMRECLSRKQQRERGYLDRRAARGTHTPTDEAYEHDQVLESELLALLDGLIDQFQRDTAGGNT